jgi:Asp-tRNA(Asn)/Glu-tRNA(Gln) amidotransferase A subunit family amidase
MSSDDALLLIRLSAREAQRRIRDGKITATALLEACLDRIRGLDGQLMAWTHVDQDGARTVARERDAEARAGRVRGPLHGVPVGIKDIFDVAGMPTTGGARPWRHRRATEDATAVARLRAAGAVIVGKTATTEFAYRDPAPTRNPWNLGHTPGGSSAGSGAAVAARMIPFASGSQTVGSVLRPAAYNGVVGLKPTHGLIPVDGVIPLAWSLDHVGVRARSVDDVALALGALTGGEYDAAAGRPPRIAVAPELIARAEPEMVGHLRAVADAFRAAGATLMDVALPPSFGGLHAAGLTVLEAEAATYHEQDFRKHGAEFGKEIRAGVEAGLATTAVGYINANRARLRFRADVAPILAAHDALLSPAVPTPAPAGLGSTGDGSLCAPWSYTGMPSVSLPSGLAASGLPLAIQLTAGAGHEQSLLRVAAWCEGVLRFSAAPTL